MDEKLPVPDRIAVIAGALAELELDSSQVPLFLLQTIERSRRRSRPVAPGSPPAASTSGIRASRGPSRAR